MGPQGAFRDAEKFFRNDWAADWVNHLTAEQAARLSRVYLTS